MLRVQVHAAGPASRNGQAGTAGLDGQDVPGRRGWLVAAPAGHGLWVVRQVADQSIWRGPGGPVVTAAFALPAAGAPPAPAGRAGC
jgi:hypothetical protein